MDYLVVAEAEDGTWFDDPDTAFGRDAARKLAINKWSGRVPRGYDIIIYKIDYVECVDLPKSERK